MNVPTELLYTEEHEWARLDDDGTVVVGVTDFASQQLGDVVYVELPAIDAEVVKGEAFGQVESTKSVSDICAPVTGTIVEINAALEDSPEMINGAPYEAGWMVRIRPESDPRAELADMLHPDEYTDHIANEDAD